RRRSGPGILESTQGTQAGRMSAAVTYLRQPSTIRERCHYILDLARQDLLPHFEIHEDKLDQVADYVLKVTRDAYPDLNVPYHSRWQHFDTPKRQRLRQFRQHLLSQSPDAQGQALYDLVIVSVLL